MKYLFKYLPQLLWYLAEGTFWFLYGLTAVIITLSYAAWHFKIPNQPMIKIDEALKEITDSDSIFKTDRIVRIVIGLILLVIVLIILSFVFFFWQTIMASFVILVCFGVILFMVS